MEEFEDELPDEAYELLAKLLPLHPAIAGSTLSGKDKVYLQYALEEEFDNDIEKLLEDIQKFAVESEEYEIAAIIRDALKKEENG
jgi:protein-arginine kinase activator protein McsA